MAKGQDEDRLSEQTLKTMLKGYYNFSGFIVSVRRHNIAAIWVAFVSRWQRYRR